MHNLFFLFFFFEKKGGRRFDLAIHSATDVKSLELSLFGLSTVLESERSPLRQTYTTFT